MYWTLDITNGDSTGGWYLVDVQSNTGTHLIKKGGNSLGMRGGETKVIMEHLAVQMVELMVKIKLL